MKGDKPIYKCSRCGAEFDDEWSWEKHSGTCGLPRYWHLSLSWSTSGWSFKQEEKVLYDYETYIRDKIGEPDVICSTLVVVDVWKEEDIPFGRRALVDAAIGMLRGEISALRQLKKGG